MTPSAQQMIVFLYTSDLAATAAFYEEALGLRLALDQGTCRIYHVAGRAYLGFCGREEAARPDGVIVTFVTPDVDGWCAALEAKGVALEAPPSVSEAYGIYHAFFRDPNGYRLEVQRFEDPRWEG